MKKALILVTIALSLFMISCQEPKEELEAVYFYGWYLYDDDINNDIYIYYNENLSLLCAGNKNEKYTDNLIDIMKSSHSFFDVQHNLTYIKDQFNGIPEWAFNWSY